ncbi:MAG: hypothetical protein ACKOER_10555, partial [Betaproteobacteria bacterium]
MSKDPLLNRSASTCAADASPGFCTDGDVPVPPMVAARACGCGTRASRLGCGVHGRRLFTGVAAASALGLWQGAAWAQATTPAAPPAPQPDEGLRKEVGKTSVFVNAVPPEQVEQAAAQQ